MLLRFLAPALVLPMLGGCVSSRVQNGATIGALSGVAVGGTVGLLISDEDLLGSPANTSTGDTSIPPGGGIAASMAIGAVVGAIVGAMVGHVNDDRYADIKLPVAAPPGAADGPDEDLGLVGEEASAPNPHVSF